MPVRLDNYGAVLELVAELEARLAAAKLPQDFISRLLRGEV